jgi:phosphoglycolate phosphatase
MTQPQPLTAFNQSTGQTQPIQAVLFDLDGTLLHTAPDLAAAANAMLAELGLSALLVEKITEFVGKGVGVLVARCLAMVHGRSVENAHLEGISGPAHEKALAAYERHYAQLNGTHAQFYPGVLEGLQRMQSTGLKLGIVTNKPQAFTEPLIDQFGLRPFMQVVVSGDTCARKKPDALPMLHACAALGVAPQHALMLGDSGNDCLAARAAGLAVWVLPYGYNEGQPVAALDCDGIVQSLEVAAQHLADGSNPHTSTNAP